MKYTSSVVVTLPVYTYSLTLVTSYAPSLHGGTGMQVNEAWFFCLDAEKNLIISDGWIAVSKCSLLMEHSYTTIGQFQDSGFFMNPHGIALMNLKLVVK